MRIILFLMMFSFFAIVVLSIVGFFLSNIFSSKKSKIDARKKAAAESSTFDYKEKVKRAIDKLKGVQLEPINLDSSVNVTQYGNDVLKNIGELSNYMYDLSRNSILETTSSIISEITNKKGYFNDDDFLKYNFIANYTKDRLIRQVSDIELNSSKYELVFKDFDKVIEHAEKTVSDFKFYTTNDAYENEILNNKKSNINLLKNKILNLKKSKLYHQQALTQLKVMLNLNNNLIVEFDNIIHQMLPLIKNHASIESVRTFNTKDLSLYIDKIRKINEKAIDLN